MAATCSPSSSPLVSKCPLAYTFDNTTADVAFHTLLASLAHVMYPVSYHEAAKLLDLEHDYDFYYLALALIRRLGDRHQKIKPAYTDSGRVSDLWHVLAESAKKSPYVSPLYLVVLRELRAGHSFPFARLALRVRLAFRDESPLATLSPAATPDIPPEDSGYRPKGHGKTPQQPSSRPTAMTLRPQKQSLALLEGKWVADSPASLYRKWVGTSYPCTVCFRMWNITDSDTRGACPYVCIEAFANDKHLGSSKPAAPRPAPGASATALSVPPPAVDPPAPPAAQETRAAAHSIRLSEPAPGGGGVIPTVDDGTLVVPAAGDSAPPLQDQGSESVLVL
ncbi:hypothetical protein CYMTET_3565 [Cymbomonas tetramitiformis]|uniref:Uncharacterized protein n=1 Tax=Cymbomonas tetramitiformis TaxID=36881 RepID=A0AAE0H2W5_9CHLO|nr:hypothetical protein CYMTET_3565 [Cymbomonas tetramitiformis]